MVLLGRRITALLRRSGQAPLPQTITFGDVTVDFSGYTASDSSGKIDIMPREIDLQISREQLKEMGRAFSTASVTNCSCLMLTTTSSWVLNASCI